MPNTYEVDLRKASQVVESLDNETCQQQQLRTTIYVNFLRHLGVHSIKVSGQSWPVWLQCVCSFIHVRLVW